MKKTRCFVETKDERVKEFLEDIMTFDNEKFNILEEIRKIVFTIYKDTNERMMYGGIMFSDERNKDWGGIFAYKDHVSFEFGQGFKLSDPDKFLEGTGKERRHLKIKSLADITKKNVEFFVKQVR